VPGFGAEITMQWQMTVDEDDGNYWTGGAIRVEDVGSISAPMSASIRAYDSSTDIDVVSSVTPSQVSSGSEETFLHTITLTNNSASPYTVEWIKHHASRDLDYVADSTGGITTGNPQVHHATIGQSTRGTWTQLF
jgi:hypothetical protein